MAEGSYIIMSMEKRINDVRSYFTKGNPILSPEWVITKRKAIPKECFLDFLNYNGFDDYLLWIFAFKKEHSFNN